MRRDELKEMLYRGFIRFHGEGYSKWSKENVRKALITKSERHELESKDVQNILEELEREGTIKLHFGDEVYLEVLEPDPKARLF